MKDIIIIILTFLPIVILISAINQIQRKKMKHFSEDDILLFIEKFKKYAKELEYNKNIKFVGGNTDSLRDSVTKNFFSKIAKNSIIEAVLLLCVFFGLSFFIADWQIVLYIFCAICSFLILIFALAVIDKKGTKTIDSITLSNNNLEIRLLDKKWQTDTKANSLMFKLNKIDIKYNIVVDSGDSSRSEFMRRRHRYVYINNNKYLILLDRLRENDFKCFITFINIFSKNININNLTNDETEKIMNLTWK